MIPGAKAPKLITRDMLKEMRRDANYDKWLSGEYLIPPELNDPSQANSIQGVDGVLYYLDDLDENFDINTGYTPPEDPFQ